MKTIIVRATSDDQTKLNTFVQKLEKYTDRQIKDAVICTKYLNTDNYNTIFGELKDAVALNDYDLFIVASVNPTLSVMTLENINRAHTLSCTDDELDSAKNFIIMI